MEIKTIVLISCGKSKVSWRSRADELYTGALFRLSLKYAHSLKPDAIYILSARHHLVQLDKMLDPYNQTLKGAKADERRQWGDVVLMQLSKLSELDRDHFVFLAGNDYIRPLTGHITNTQDPMKGMGIGERLAWLKSHVS